MKTFCSLASIFLSSLCNHFFLFVFLMSNQSSRSMNLNHLQVSSNMNSVQWIWFLHFPCPITLLFERARIVLDIVPYRFSYNQYEFIHLGQISIFISTFRKLALALMLLSYYLILFSGVFVQSIKNLLQNEFVHTNVSSQNRHDINPHRKF